MKRRLMRAYDHMTMPDDCARRIEDRLQTELENRAAGKYTKVISPAPQHRSSWAAAAACLLLVLVMGGAGLHFWKTPGVVEIPQQQQADDTVATDTPTEQVDSAENQRVTEVFETILSGEPVEFYGNRDEMTVQEYCSALWGDGVAVNAFTLADMDDDGINELVFSTQDTDGVTGGYMVLRLDGEKICGYTLRGRDLRKDGTFYSYTAKENAKLRCQDEVAYFVESTDFSQQEKPLAQWHVYPCQMPSLVLESYRYASETGFSTYPGYGYYYFELLSHGEMANDWSQIQYWMSREGACLEDKNMVYAYDSDAPGCVFYGVLTGEGEERKFTTIGYYICDETGEYRAEVFDLDQPNPIYTVDPPPDDRGKEVETPEEMMAYLGHEPYYEAINRDTQKIAELLDGFVWAYAQHDTKAMEEYMAATAGDLTSYPFTGEISILNYGILPDAAVNIGGNWHSGVELLESGEPNSYYHLSVELVKQTDGWKIQAYGLEKQ